MKFKLNELKLSAVVKSTGQEFGVRGWRTGPLDKNQSGAEVTLDKAHNGYPMPMKWDEVEVSIEIPTQTICSYLFSECMKGLFEESTERNSNGS